MALLRGLNPAYMPQQPQGSLGQELGAGLGQGLEMLAQQRLQDLAGRAERQRTASGLQEIIAGLSPERAQALSGLSEKQLSDYMKMLGEQGRAAGFERALQGLGGGAAPGQVPTQEPVTPGGAPKIGDPALSTEDNRRLAEMRQRDVHFGQKQKLEKQKLFQDREDTAYRKEINAQRTLHDIKNMLELEQRGQLNDPKYLQFLEAMGADYDQLKNPETSIYEKLNSRFIMSIKDAFKGKISDNQMAAFLKQFPKLTQSPIARKVVLKLLESAYQADQLEAQAIRDIREQYGDNLPLDFSSQINKRIMPELERLSVSVGDLLENPFILGEGTEIATVPEASPANRGKAYFDTESNTWKISDGSKMITAKDREQAKKVVDRIKGR